jgi:DinB superfamily
MAIQRPKKDEYAPFHGTYIQAVPPRSSAQSLLRSTWRDNMATFGTWPEAQGDWAYEDGKWTVKQLLIHMIDTERVFAMRALWFMRGDRAPLPGFNQDFWMEYADVSNRSIKDLLKEWKAVRDNTLALLAQCSDEQSKQMGQASNSKFSVRAMFFITIGHNIHHLKVFKERYVLPE